MLSVLLLVINANFQNPPLVEVDNREYLVMGTTEACATAIGTASSSA
jgi:hypothetical protein